MTEILAKSILNKTKRRDPWFLDDYTLNPYSACSFNCLYCYIRGSKYGLHMEEKLAIKSNAPELLEKVLALRARKGQHGIIVLSSATDPYLQIEKDTLLTRQLLQLIRKYRFPLHVITKSDLVIRDLDLLTEINEQAILPADLKGRLAHGVFITFSFSTVDDAIGKIFEPGATAPSRRLEAMKEVIDAKFHSGVSLMPLLPFISDTQEHLELMYEKFREAGVNYIFPASLTLFGEGIHDSKTLMFEAVKKNYPALLSNYEKLFGSGFQVPTLYQQELRTRTMALGKIHGIPNSLFRE